MTPPPQRHAAAEKARRPKGQSSLLVAASLVATSLLAALQAFALLVICGSDARTEAFLAAYVLYLPVAVLGSSLRATVSALVARVPVTHRALQANEVVSRCAPVWRPHHRCDACAHPRPGAGDQWRLVLRCPVDHGRGSRVSAPAAFLHIIAAALPALSVRYEQFRFSATHLRPHGTTSLIVSVVMLLAIGPLGARRRGPGRHRRTRRRAPPSWPHDGHPAFASPRERCWNRDQRRIAAEVLSGAALGFALQTNLAISVVALGAQDGAITAYSYAYFMTAMLLSLSSLPLALVTLPDLVGAVRRCGRRAVADHLVRCAPFAYAIVLPLAFAIPGVRTTARNMGVRAVRRGADRTARVRRGAGPRSDGAACHAVLPRIGRVVAGRDAARSSGRRRVGDRRAGHRSGVRLGGAAGCRLGARRRHDHQHVRALGASTRPPDA